MSERMDNEALYQERYGRILKAIDLQPVSRIALIYMGMAFSLRYMVQACLRRGGCAPSPQLPLLAR